MKVLIPISVSTELFSSENMRKGLSIIPNQYDEYVYLIGDKLQVYNYAAENKDTDQRRFSRRWMQNMEKQLKERSSWITRLHDAARGRAVVIGIDDVVDAQYASLVRQLSILYVTDRGFSREVNLVVAEAVKRRRQAQSKSITRRLSVLYVVEELALNLAARKKFCVYDEYYLGPQLKLLLELFKGKYLWFLDEIGYTANYPMKDVRFFAWIPHDGEFSWKEQRV